ncbi:hypothetical protein HETIRDRAFT_108372 [Heterobasidion irregulare TC 32-1]|uniref:Uncharacterized protein n=1 Tax=Heterobasidion irregulare (strain TC 32-1) TaxID=747525 RepID=W4JN13_HETIT|nr:uncharacterized protein HETIRDRAFT_108372 [Heterobasidion irregulare TC 32-1]ETW74952.1 hypothetical protein HETIRDRAFT_108372 [Heterobasidion irregulare TC 32-1]
MSTDPGDRMVYQVRAPTSPTSREPSALQGIAFTDSPTSNLYTQPHPSSSQLSQPVDLNMEVYSPTESRPESPSMPPSPAGTSVHPIFLSTTDSFDQQSDVVTSSLHSIADWLETVDWDAILGRNPLDAATLNSSPLAAAATRVIRYLNAGIVGRSTKVPELQAARPSSAISTQPGPAGTMTYANAVSRSLPAPSSNRTNRSTTRPASRLANTVNDSFVEDIFRLREAHPNLSASELLALQRQAASP